MVGHRRAPSGVLLALALNLGRSRCLLCRNDPESLAGALVGHHSSHQPMSLGPLTQLTCALLIRIGQHERLSRLIRAAYTPALLIRFNTAWITNRVTLPGSDLAALLKLQQDLEPPDGSILMMRQFFVGLPRGR